MPKRWMTPILVAIVLVLWQNPCSAYMQAQLHFKALTAAPIIAPSIASSEPYLPDEDSRELMLQDMLTLFLLPQMEKQVAEIYAPLLKESPVIYPYFVSIIDANRVNGFRGFDFLVTLKAVPTVGPHIPVGEDTFTFRISPGPKVKLESFKHLKDPQRSDFPPNYQNILR